MTKVLYWLAVVFIGAVIVHICVVFLVPVYGESPLMERLKHQSDGWQFVVLDDNHPISVRQDPSFRLQICHFDLSEGLAHLTAEGGVPFWSLSLYDKDANNLYSLNSRVMPGERLDLVIGDPLQIMDYKRYSALEGQETSILTQHNIWEGFVLLRVYVPSSDWEPLAQEFLTSARCDKING